MSLKLIFTPEAADDISVAHSWYEDKRKGLGEEFLRCVEACVQIIARSPEMNLKVHENYRRALVRRFPYAVFYESGRKSITIYAVFHTSREPEKWRSRFS